MAKKKPATRRKPTRRKAAPKKVDKVYDWVEGLRFQALEVWHLMSNDKLRKRTKGEARQGVLLMDWKSMRSAFDSGKLTGQALEDVKRFLKVAATLNDDEAQLLWSTLKRFHLHQENPHRVELDAKSEILARAFHGDSSPGEPLREGGDIGDASSGVKGHLSEMVQGAETAVRPDSSISDEEQTSEDSPGDGEVRDSTNQPARVSRSSELFTETLRKRRAGSRDS